MQFVNIHPGTSIDELRAALLQCQGDLLYLKLRPQRLEPGPRFEKRVELAFHACPDALMLYSAHSLHGPQSELQPLIDYQEGSLRDDFDFGPLVVLHRQRIMSRSAEFLDRIGAEDPAWYALRLRLCQAALPLRLEESSYDACVEEAKDSEKEHFSYVDPRNTAFQKRLESAFTSFAREAGFYLPPEQLKQIDPSAAQFENEASIIIPVKDRAATVRDAVRSALSQRCSFNFNLLVVDNHSSDGTTEILKNLAEEDKRLVHLVPEESDLQIGGCWNYAINHKSCGRFSVQLDSDDIYRDEHTLQKIVDCFNATRAAAVVGSYTIVDMHLRELPPGLIDHREWTDENGHNNALRINGFGAPRAYYTPVVREAGFPNLSYGEDYAAMLAISRGWRIGRIYESLYLCRRWEGNSDARPSIEKLNRFNSIKDGIRTEEVRKRRALVGR